MFNAVRVFGHLFWARFNTTSYSYSQANAEQFGNSNAEWAEWQIGDFLLVGKPQGIFGCMQSCRSHV